MTRDITFDCRFFTEESSRRRHLNSRVMRKNDTKPMRIDLNNSVPQKNNQRHDAKTSCVAVENVWRMKLYERGIIIVDLLT